MSIRTLNNELHYALRKKKRNLSRGSSEQNACKFGINISKQNLPKQASKSSFQTQIEDFFCRDDITKLCLDKKKQIHNHQVRYPPNNLNIFHQQFKSEINIDIDYVTSTRYVPSYIQKPIYDN